MYFLTTKVVRLEKSEVCSCFEFSSTILAKKLKEKTIATTLTNMGVGIGGRTIPWILKFPAKKGCFIRFEWEKTNFTTFGTP